FRDAAERKRLEFRVLTEIAAPRLRGDGGRLRQIVVNLVSNAIKFTERGEVLLHVRSTRCSESDSARVEIIVSDTGPGIAKADHDRVFEAFTQLDATRSRRHDGTGLGLAICRQIVSLMGGRIELANHPGRGTTFTVIVPFALAPRAQSRFSGRGGVLIVDDDATNRAVLAAMLEEFSLEVVAAASADEGLRALRERCDLHLAFIDGQMPGMDGLEMARVWREQRPDSGVALIALTAQGSSAKPLFLSAGFDDFVSKPATLERLEEVLRRWLSRPTPEVAHRETDSPSVVETVEIDAERFASLAELGADRSFRARLLDVFGRDAPELVAEVERATARGEPEAVRRAVHRLRSSAAQLGAVGLARLCERIESEPMADDVTRLRGALDATIVELRSLMGEGSEA
ncbi:MAG: response regulator, partial [Planctomycetes bacterium]|nr:response regulator [Planctomycetota bacterium]